MTRKSSAGDKRQDSQGEVQRGEAEFWNVLDSLDSGHKDGGAKIHTLEHMTPNRS